MVRKTVNYILSNRFNYLDIMFLMAFLLVSFALDLNAMIDLAILYVWMVVSEYLKYRLIKEV